MNKINAYNMLDSVKQVLVPADDLIDGRTELDRLSFFTDFSSLINFYDENNNISGNWTPFMLKDPLFLLASIAQTPFNDIHSLYVQTSARLKTLLEPQPAQVVVDLSEVPMCFNELFDQLFRVFMCIKRWIHYMHKAEAGYDLKTYVIDQTQNNFSAYFWALISLRQNLFLTSAIKGIEFVDPDQFYLYEHFEKKIWKQNKDKSPYWEVLDIKHPITKNNDTDFFDALSRIGDLLFRFFQTIIIHAPDEYEKLKSRKSKHPDTMLLRAFVDLLQVQQKQLNGIAGKHLEFYYHDILKQYRKAAKADSTVLFATLAAPDQLFTLPAGTVFSARVDANKKPVQFSSVDPVILNPGVITDAVTLFNKQNTDNTYSIYQQNIAKPPVINKDQNGVIQSWSTFGGESSTKLADNVSAFIFGSPMLLLNDGLRTIVLTIYFNDLIDQAVFQNAGYDLSTAADWVDVTKYVAPPVADVTGKMLIITINLDALAAPVLPFAKSLDNLQSAWPMFRLRFNSIPNPAKPPVVMGIDLSVTVSGSRNLQLYNDSGALSTKAPFPPFGPTPQLNSNFLIGSAELLSKPLQSAQFDVTWSTLPGDFSAYYNEYNEYLKGEDEPPGLLSRFWNWITGNEANAGVIAPPIYFANDSFKVNFQQLQNHRWNDVTFVQTKVPTIPATTDNENLFGLDDNRNLINTGSFTYASEPSGELNILTDPALQLKPLTYTEATAFGFLRIQLEGLSWGFGSDLYPQVIYQIALDNAIALKRIFFKEYKAAPQIPFAPKLTDITVTYTASTSYVFNGVVNADPVDCFITTPFATYKVYDNVNGYLGGQFTFPQTEAPAQKGLVLFPVIAYPGMLFLGFDTLLPTAGINIYFELTQKTTNGTAADTVNYFYYSSSGWKTLSLLADETDGFTCSGILKLNIPADIVMTAGPMPIEKYWLAIAVGSNAETYAQTVCINTNAFRVKRSGDEFTDDVADPYLDAAAITGPLNAIPQIAQVTQPYPTTGGKRAEDKLMMIRRVSSRLATKDRAVTTTDIYDLIQQQFSDIYYSKAIFDKTTRKTNVYVLTSVNDDTSPNSFLPFVTACKADKITHFLSTKMSAFVNFEVQNFEIQYVQVSCMLTAVPDTECASLKKQLNRYLNLYLSPWIKSDVSQVAIDEPIYNADAANFIKQIPGVSDVLNVSFRTWIPGSAQPVKPLFFESVAPFHRSAILATYGDHDIQIIAM